METKKEKREAKASKFMKMGCLSFIIIVAVVSLIIAVLPSDSSTSNSITASAYIVSQEYVKKQLQFPEEADFPIIPVLSEIQEGTDSLYRVAGDVTYKNAFGVKSKSRYLMRMKFKGGEALNAHNWEVVDFDIDR